MMKNSKKIVTVIALLGLIATFPVAAILLSNRNSKGAIDANGLGYSLSDAKRSTLRKNGELSVSKTFVQTQVNADSFDMRFAVAVKMSDNVKSIILQRDREGVINSVDIDTVYKYVICGGENYYYNPSTDELTKEVQENDYYFAAYSINIKNNTAQTSENLAANYKLTGYVNGSLSNVYLQTSYNAAVCEEPCVHEDRLADTIIGYKISDHHTWDGGKITKEPTHFEDGEKLYTCTECGVTKTEKIDKILHKFDREVVAPQYLKEGVTYYKSCACGEASTTDTFVIYRQMNGSEFALRETSHNPSYALNDSEVGGRNAVYKYVGSGCTYADVLGLTYFNHEKIGDAAQATIKKAIADGIKYVLFDMYLETGATIRIYNINQNNSRQGRVDSNATGALTYTDLEQDKIQFFDSNGNKLSKLVFGSWMSVLLDISHLSSGCQQYVYNTFAATNGTLYLDNVRYYRFASYVDDYGISLQTNIVNPYANETAGLNESFEVKPQFVKYNGIDLDESEYTVEVVSNNPSIASVNGNVVNFVGVGNATLTATITCNGMFSDVKKSIDMSIKVFDRKWVITNLSSGVSLTPNQSIGGLDNVTKFVCGTPAWNYILELYETSHVGPNGSKYSSNPTNARDNLLNNGIKYISFKIYAQTLNDLKINHIDTDSGQFGNIVVSSTGEITKTNSSRLKMYNSQGDEITSSFPKEEWVSIVLDISTLNKKFAQYASLEISNVKGTFYLDTVHFNYVNPIG